MIHCRQFGLRIDEAVGGKQESVQIHLTFRGKINKTATRKVFGSQMNTETCFMCLGVPKVRLATCDRKDRFVVIQFNFTDLRQLLKFGVWTVEVSQMCCFVFFQNLPPGRFCRR